MGLRGPKSRPERRRVPRGISIKRYLDKWLRVQADQRGMSLSMTIEECVREAYERDQRKRKREAAADADADADEAAADADADEAAAEAE
jgi:hypothetical protein